MAEADLRVCSHAAGNDELPYGQVVLQGPGCSTSTALRQVCDGHPLEGGCYVCPHLRCNLSLAACSNTSTLSCDTSCTRCLQSHRSAPI